MRSTPRLAGATTLFTLLLAACTGRPVIPPTDASVDSSDSAATDAGADVPIDAASLAACNPLGAPGSSCVLPFPSAYYEASDPSRASGMRVTLTRDALPTTRTAIALDPAPWNRNDGFSPIGPFLAEFPERIDPATLVPPHAMAHSLDTDSPTVILDMETGERVPHFSEVDAMASSTQRQVVIIRPARRLKAGHRYALAITRAVRSTTGAEPTISPGFQDLLDGAPERDPRLARVADRYDAIFTALEHAGVARTQLLLAWDVVTASEQSLTGPMLGMRDDALTMVGTDGLGLSITQIEDDFDASILRRVHGTIRVPRFLTIDGGDRAVLARDASGRAMITTVDDVPFVATIPRRALTDGPLPMLMVGHGLFGGAEGELGDATAATSFHQQFANEFGYVMFATDWTGLTMGDLPHVLQAMSDFNRMPEITERVQQALVNAMVLYRTARARFAGEAAFSAGGHVVVDPSRTYYLGISLGGILGTSFMGYDPDCDRGALNVFGGVWSTLFQRNDGWPGLRLAISAYPRNDDQQVLLALAQSLFDPTDPINVAPHLFADLLPGVTPRHLLFQEAVGDTAVSNLATETVARTMGVSLVAPSVRTVFGLTEVDAPLPSALQIVDEMPTPLPPETNEAPTRNSTHITMRSEPMVREQTHRFLQSTGTVEHTCDGPCDPN